MKHGIPLIAFLIVAAICGVVGYVIGYQRHVRLIEEGVSRGYLEDTPYGPRWLHYEGFDALRRQREIDEWKPVKPE
jgi:hypothetical protein